VAEVSEPIVVEIPLDPEFVTEAGFYMAGYLWGQKIRSADDPEVQCQHPAFIEGVEDGYGDGLTRINEETSIKSAEAEKRRQRKLDYWDDGMNAPGRRWV
jgi:hypothetical protein